MAKIIPGGARSAASTVAVFSWAMALGLTFEVGVRAAGEPVSFEFQATKPNPLPPALVARVGRWLGDPVQTTRGPKGFDLEFRLVGLRFDGTFGVEGLPQSVPEGEAFEARVNLTNIGTKDIKVTSVLVTGDGMLLTTEMLAKKVRPKSSSVVARFKVPPQSSKGSTFLITVVMGNGDKHQATLSFSRPPNPPRKT